MAHSNGGATVDGKHVSVEIDSKTLRWVETEAERRETSVSLKSIIGIVPALPSQTDEFKLLYTAAAGEDDGKSKLLFKSALVTGFPKSFLDSNQPHGQGWWHKNASDSRRPVNIVVSTGSGTGLASAVWDRLVKPMLQSLGLTNQHYTVHFTTSENSVVELTRSFVLPTANEGREQLVLFLSGDGGVVDFVNTLLSEEQTQVYRKPTMALLPLGTGNALANSTVVGEDETMGLRTLLCGSSKGLPLFKVTFSDGAKLLVNEGRDEEQLEGVYNGNPVAYGAVVCSWGLHAALVADSDTAEYRKFGAERFKMAANEALFPSDGSLPHAYRGRVTVLRPGHDQWTDVPRAEHGYVLVTLVSHLEAGFSISPHSQPLDKKLRLIHFGHVSGQEAMEIMTEAYQGGKHAQDDRVGYEEISGLRIHFDEEDGRWRRVCIDGKIIRVEKGGWVEVMIEDKTIVDLIARVD